MAVTINSPTSWFDWQISLMEGALAACRDDAERAQHLDGWFQRWQARYARFVASEGDSERHNPEFGSPSATDFVLVIGEISRRRHALADRVPA